MSYKLYTDKPNKFSCNIQVDGTSLSNSKVRLVVESDDMNYMFNGVIYENGVCEVTIPKTKNFLPENKKGLMKLEVVADDVFFEPWTSEFVVETTKKVAVVVQEQEEQKPTVKVQMISQPESKKPVVERNIVEKPVVKTSNSITKKELFDILKRK